MYALSAVLAAAGFGLLVGLGAGGWGAWAWNDWQTAREERAIAKAQVELASKNAKDRDIIQDGIAERQKAFEKGRAEGLAAGRRVGTKVAEVTKGSGFNNPQCVAGQEAFALYKAALGSVTGGKIPEELLTASPQPMTPPPTTPQPPTAGATPATVPAARPPARNPLRP